MQRFEGFRSSSVCGETRGGKTLFRMIDNNFARQNECMGIKMRGWRGCRNYHDRILPKFSERSVILWLHSVII